jgi:hypothetical protein
MNEPEHNPLCGSDGLCPDCIASKTPATAPVPSVEVAEAEDADGLFIDYGTGDA